MRAGELGPLSFGMGSSIAQSLLGPMVLRLLADAPGLHVDTLVQSTDVLAAALKREELDFFVGDVRVAANDRDLIAEPLLSLHLRLVRPRGTSPGRSSRA